jgi:stage III sporulation protein AG
MYRVDGLQIEIGRQKDLNRLQDHQVYEDRRQEQTGAQYDRYAGSDQIHSAKEDPEQIGKSRRAQAEQQHGRQFLAPRGEITAQIQGSVGRDPEIADWKQNTSQIKQGPFLRTDPDEPAFADIVTQIEGVGKAQIFLTMDNGGESVYLKNTDTKTVSIEPKVRGVVVVCDGGDDPVVVSRVMDAVTKALNIRSDKVCITK